MNLSFGEAKVPQLYWIRSALLALALPDTFRHLMCVGAGSTVAPQLGR